MRYPSSLHVTIEKIEEECKCRNNNRELVGHLPAGGFDEEPEGVDDCAVEVMGQKDGDE